MFEILFQYGPVTVRTFNVILAVGFVLTTLFLLRYALRKKMNIAFISYAFLPLLPISLLGGRLLYVIKNWGLFAESPLHIFFIWDMQFDFFGIFCSLIAGLFFLCRKRKEDFWAWLDLAIFSLLFMMVFVHLGDFFSGANYGVPTNLPWGIAFDNLTMRYSSPVHPTQLYAMVFTLVLVANSVKTSRRVYLSGVVASRTFMIYSLGMFLLDFLHGTPSWYTKVGFLVMASLSFVVFIHCSHKSHSFGGGHEPSL